MRWFFNGSLIEKRYPSWAVAAELASGTGVAIGEPFGFPDNAVIYNEDGSGRARLRMAGACTDRTDCEIAQETLGKCDTENAAVTDSLGFRRLPLRISGDCSGVNACVASCVNDTNCTTISWVELGGGVDPNGPPVPKDAGVFIGCLQKCMGLPRGS